MKNAYLLWTTILMVTVASSCQKDALLLDQSILAVDNQIKGDYEVQNGTLHFKDSDAFLKVQKTLVKMTHDERLKFAEVAGFKSLLTHYDEFSKASVAVKDGPSFQTVLEKYADIVTLDDTHTPIFNVQSPLLSSYVDRTGVVYIGKILYRFGDKEQTMVFDGDRTKLNDPESVIVKHIRHNLDAANGRLSSTCRYFYNKGLSDGYISSSLSVYAQTTSTMQGNGKYQVTLTPYAIGRSYINTNGIYRARPTANSMFAHWTYTAYSTESGQPGPNNSLSVSANSVFDNGIDFSIEFYGDIITFSNLNNPGSVFDQFDFPTDNGWHKTNAGTSAQDIHFITNSMSCP